MQPVIIADANIPFVGSMYDSIGDLRLVEGYSITPDTVRDADILLIRSVTRIGKSLLEGSKIQFVGAVTSGYDHIDLQYLSSKGIRFAYAAGCNSNSVAEYIVAAILVLIGRFGLNLSRMLLGVVGIGNVGSKVVRKAAAMGIKVVQNDPPLKRKSGRQDLVSLNDMMDADIITLHVPLTYKGRDATQYLFDERRIAAMKPGSVLINTARGPVVKNEALRNALRSGHLRPSVLDVWEHEPEIDLDIMSMAAIGTPHIAGYSIEGKTNGALMIYQAVCDYLGIAQTWTREGELPSPWVPKIRIDNPNQSEADLPSEIVKKCYDVEADDARLRGVLNMKPEERKNYFNRLRTEYPLRREFAATVVEIPKSHKEIANCIEGIGFSVSKI